MNYKSYLAGGLIQIAQNRQKGGGCLFTFIYTELSFNLGLIMLLLLLIGIHPFEYRF